MDRTIRQYYRVERQSISFIRFILEGYDNLAVLTTLDRQKGMVMLSISPGCEAEINNLIEELKANLLIQQMPVPLETATS